MEIVYIWLTMYRVSTPENKIMSRGKVEASQF
jgi:hypothetical protein